MDCAQSWTVHEGELESQDVRDLLALHLAEMRADSPPEACHVLPIDELRDPAIRFFSIREDGRLLAVGALKSLEHGHGEIKSMRAARDALGRGIGRALLNHLIAEAQAAGITKLSLETGNSALFDAANHLYLTAGFERCAPFGQYRDTPFTHFYTRII